MPVDLDKLNFYSGVNYMKRLVSDSTSVGTTKKVINHDLGYPPQFVWYADLFGDNMLWYGGECVSEGTESTAGGASLNPDINAWVRDNTLTLYPSNYTSGSKTAYYVIYRDYGANI